MLRLTSSFKNEHPHITVSQKCLWKQKALALVMPGERTPVSLSPRGENCVASLFVRFFTSLLTSTQIKMTIQSEGSEAQSRPPLHLFHFMRIENAMSAKKKVCIWLLEVVCVCVNASISPCSESEVVFGTRERTTLRSKFPLQP